MDSILSQLKFSDYDYIIIAFSGGKDSQSCVLSLLEAGVPKEKIELWHHEIDGREGSTLMDWPSTPSYCRAFARALDIPIYFSWKEGGFEREMLRNNQPTAPTHYESPDGAIHAVGGAGPPNTRLKFPQVSADLSVRWCSAYTKIDVGAAAIRNQERFLGKKTLFITGERAEESSARAKYRVLEPDRADRRNGKRKMRLVDHFRPVHLWNESEVWDIIKRWKIRPHPAYELGWARLSCCSCIFGSKDQFASLERILPAHVKRISDYEKQFGVTIKRKESVEQLVNSGTPYKGMKAEIIKLALSNSYSENIILNKWQLPAGAFGENAGPT